MKHWVLELYQDSSNNDLRLTLLAKIKHWQILEQKILWKVVKTFAKKCSNDDLGLAFDTFMARSNFDMG